MNPENRYITYCPSPVGLIRISGSQSCISGINFQDDEKDGADGEHGGNHAASEYLPPLLSDCRDQLTRYFNGSLQQFNFPQCQAGSSFQESVWHLLAAIPYGRTISYIQLAVRTGDPLATRAVASANGRNNLAIVVPCHRVIGADGSLTGYGGGIWRKRWLLEHEARISHGVQSLF